VEESMVMLRKILVSLWWLVGRRLLRMSPGDLLPVCLTHQHIDHINLNGIADWQDKHPDFNLTRSDRRLLWQVEAFWLLSPLDKTLFFAWLWEFYGTERLSEEFSRMARSSEHVSVVRGIEPLAHAFGFLDPVEVA
jgi:hypothetical protein